MHFKGLVYTKFSGKSVLLNLVTLRQLKFPLLPATLMYNGNVSMYQKGQWGKQKFSLKDISHGIELYKNTFVYHSLRIFVNVMM